MKPTTPLIGLRTLRRGAPLMLALGLALVAPPTRAAVSYYVNDGSTSNDFYCTAIGGDENDGLSPAAPVASLQTVLDRYTLGPSATVYVDVGLYALPSNIVVEARHSGNTSQFVNIWGVQGLSFLRHEAAGEPGSRCLVNHASFISISGLTFMGAEVGLSMNAFANRSATIQRNLFLNNSGAGLEVFSAGQAASGAFLVENNVFHSTGDGMRLGVAPVASAEDRFVVLNNTVAVANNQTALDMGGASTNSDVRNNILVASGGTCLAVSNQHAVFASDYNTLWAPDGGAVGAVKGYGSPLTRETLAGWQRLMQTTFGTACEAHSFSRDPAFATLSGGDFHLKSAGGRWVPGEGTNGTWQSDTGVHSPCIDAADPLTQTHRLNHEPWPNGGRKNMGAYGGTTQASKAAPTRRLQLLAPDFGLDPQPIHWNATGSQWSYNSPLWLEYSINGVTWAAITDARYTASYGTFYWSRPPESFGLPCLIRIADMYRTVSDTAVLPAWPDEIQPSPSVFYVNDSSRDGDLWCSAVGSDANDGLNPETPVATLQSILDRYTLKGGDTVYIDVGLYPLASDTVIGTHHGGDWELPVIIRGAGRETVLSRTSSGADTCCISNLAGNIRFQGLAFTGADVGLVVDSAACAGVTVQDNAFHGNAYAGLVIRPATYSQYGQFRVANNLFYDNPNGMMLAGYSDFTVVNNTAVATNGAALAMDSGSDGFVDVRNNILVARAGGTCLDIVSDYVVGQWDYNNLWPSDGAQVVTWRSYGMTNAFASLAAWQRFAYSNYYATCEAHSISRDPCFAAPESGDYHLKSFGGRWQAASDPATGGVWVVDETAHSPCIDSADPWSFHDDLGQEPDPNGGRKNMGAYGGRPQASKTPPGRLLLALAPDLGQEPFCMQTIHWVASGQQWTSNDTVRLDFSLDGGGTWSAMAGGGAVAATDEFFQWDRPEASFGSLAGCLIRVAATDDLAVSDQAFLENTVERAPTVFYVNDGKLSSDVWCSAIGNNANDGLSPSTPKATVQSVLATYQPGVGATIYVDAGTYLLTEDLVLPDTGAGDPEGEWFQLIGVGTRTIFDRQSTYGDSTCLRILQDCTRVTGILFRGAKTGIAIDPNSCRNAELNRNVFTANSGYAIHVLPDPVDQGTDSYAIRNNLLYGNAEGMNLQADAGYRRACFTVENNTVDIFGKTAIRVGGQSRGTVLRNNILSVKGGGAYCLSVEQADALSTCNYNNLYAYGGAGVARWLFNGTLFTAAKLAAWQNATGWDGASLSQKAHFVSDTDFHLRSVNGSWRGTAWIADATTSPCIDAGDPASAYALEPQPSGGRVNMGAYGNTEQASKSASVRSLTLLTPRTGEVWPRPTTITWSATGTGWVTSDSIRLDYAVDTGPWLPIANATNLAPTASFLWEAPNSSAASAIFRIRATCNRDTSISAMIVSAPVNRTAAIYYINDTSSVGDRYCTAPGNSNNSGTTSNQPALSLYQLLQNVTLRSGDTVYWDAGIYSQTVNTVGAQHSGAPDAPIRIVGVPRATQVVRTEPGACLQIRGDHIRVEGLTLRSGSTGIEVDAATAKTVVLVGNRCINNSMFGISVKPFFTVPPAPSEFQILQNEIVTDQSGGAGIYLQGGYNMDGTDSKSVFIVENNTVRTPRICIRMVSTGNSSQRTHYLKNNIFETTGTDGNSICIVTRPTALNYSDYNNLYAPGGFVGAWEGYGTMFTNLAAWRAASGQDRNSLGADSRFLAPQSNDLRLTPDSPCVDAGVNSFWMFGATDADANPRIVGRSADLGAYELNLRTMVRFFLQGAYQGPELMSASLSQNGYLPTTSPYAEDPRSVAAIPSNATDWALLQFRQTPNGPAVLSRSAFLDHDGFIVDDSGDPGINASLSPDGAYHVVVKHRNHLAAMSASPIAFSNQTLSCDFTTNADSYFGGAAACVAVVGMNGTRYALRAGDVDGDGEVAALDQTVWQSQSTATGYRRSDVNLGGYTSTDDFSWIMSNLGVTSPVPRPETLLTPALRISPSRQTVQAGEALTLTGWTTAETLLTSSDATVPVTGQVVATSLQPLYWGFARNDSGAGATLATSGLSQAVYTPGSVTGRTDIVQAWDDADALGRSILNVFDAQAAAAAGQALVIAGRTSSSDTLWPATDYLANTAYTTLRYRGFAKENIHYLSPEPNRDVDGNGYLDDIDAESTFAEAACAFTNRVAGAAHLFVYLVDHGGNSSGNGYFRLNASETLTAGQLDVWLDALQDTHNSDVIVLLDFCYAGSFLPALAYTGTATRIVIAACTDAQPSYFVSGGLVSFSGAFFSGVMLGYDVSNCFAMASSAMSSYQTAMLDDNQDGLYTANDGALSSGLYIGPTYVAAGDAPVIGEVCGNQVLTEETAATVWIGSISSVNPITRAWCLVIPPGHDPDPDNPVTDLPTFELAYDSSDGHYSVTYDGFTAPGTYNVTFYVQDAEGNVSLPRQAYIAQTGYDDRIILVAGGDTNSAAWPAVEHLAELAYATFRLRLFTPDRMCILTPSGSHDFDGDGTNDVSGQASCANLQAAIGEWAVSNTTDRLTLYLLGEGATNTFRLNATESLTTHALAGWVHDFQATNPVPVTLVLDFSGAGAFLPSLADTDASPDVSRIAIASTRAGQEALFANDGTVSFTQYLLSGIITGNTLGEAFIDARRAIRRISGNVRQKAQLDDTRNGVANEKNIDGAVAAVTYLGSAFVTGADAPSIESVMPPVVLHDPGASVTLWAAGVSGMHPISNVWCVVTPPDATPADELPSIPLVWNDETDRYEAVATGFTQPGAYVLTCYARDTAGTLSAPEQSEVIRADAYEPDDEAEGASFYYGPFQSHTFHTSNDVDWVRTYLVSNFIYEIETDHISERLDSVIDFYREDADGTLSLLDHVDEEGDDLGEYTGIDYPASGWYWVRLSAYAHGTNQIGAYTFSIELPAAATCSLIVLGVDDVDNSALPSGSYATVTGKGTKYFSGSTTVTYTGLASGNYTVTVPAPAHHICREDPNTPGQVQNINSFYYGNPRRVAVSGSWTIAGFEFLSTVTVTAGVVRDAWTGAFLDNAQLTFTAASGSLAGTVVDGSIMLTSYSTDWKSQTDGLFPTGVILGACDWDLAVSRTNYTTTTQADAISSPAIGANLDLGTVYLVPTDTNSNAVADDWEAEYFPAGMDPDADDDNDGIPNRSEYRCGTDPTNAASVLRFLNAQLTPEGMSLTWSVAGGRDYRILALTSLTDTASAVTNGPWEAAHGETTRMWTDTGAALHNTRFYRIRLSTP